MCVSFVCMWRVFWPCFLLTGGLLLLLALLAAACRQDEQVARSRLAAHLVVLSLLQAALVCVAILQRQSSMVWPRPRHDRVQLQQRGGRGSGAGVWPAAAVGC